MNKLFPSLAQTEAGIGRTLISFPIYRVDGRRHLEILGIEAGWLLRHPLKAIGL